MMLRRTPHFDFAPPHRDLQSRWGLEPRVAGIVPTPHPSILHLRRSQLGRHLGRWLRRWRWPCLHLRLRRVRRSELRRWLRGAWKREARLDYAWIAAPAAAAVLVTDSAQFSSGAGVRSMGGVGCGVGCGGSVSTGEGSSPGAPASVAPSSAAAAFFAAGSSPGSQRARSGASASGTNSSAPSRQTGVSAGSAPCAIHTANVAVGNGPCT
jgi:hypothetical protein